MSLNNRRNMKKPRLDQKQTNLSWSIWLFLVQMQECRTGEYPHKDHSNMWVEYPLFFFVSQANSVMYKKRSVIPHSLTTQQTFHLNRDFEPTKFATICNATTPKTNGGTGKNLGSWWQHRCIRLMTPPGCDGPLPRLLEGGRSSHRGWLSKPQGLGASRFGWQGFF